MTAVPASRRATAVVVAQSLVWLWLICLSVLVLVGYRTLHDSTDRERIDLRLQHLEGQIAELADVTQVLQQRPAGLTAADLQDARNTLEERIEQVAQALDSHAATEDLQALRDEIGEIRAHQVKARAPTAAPQRSPKPVAARRVPPPLPFRIVGAELRAGERSVTVAPATGDFTADQVQVLMPGDAVGRWRLQVVTGGTAVFLADGQTRRVAIP